MFPFGASQILVRNERNLRLIIRQYTLEAGVRGLARRVQAVFRKLAFAAASGLPAMKRVRATDVEPLLGPPDFLAEVRRKLTIHAVSHADEVLDIALSKRRRREVDA